jgi:hypothetical protein
MSDSSNPYAPPQKLSVASREPPEGAEGSWQSQAFNTLWAVAAAFGVYFCMYAFRKPFTAASFEGLQFGTLPYKTLLVAAQVLGYTISKFIGIKVIAEMPPARRAIALVCLVTFAELALLLFALVPSPYNVICLFLNGLPLGMVFGLVLGFLEGRRLTEALTAGLCASFILADGVMKTVGAQLLERGVSETWMPATAGLLFFPPLLLTTWMLSRIPPPAAADIAARAERTPMLPAERLAFRRRYGVGLFAIVVAYLCVTILRSIRADFAPEIWASLGVTKTPNVFAQSEIWVAMGVLLANGLAITLRSNRVAFFASLGICLAGLALGAGVQVWRITAGCDPFLFMVLFGLGLYLPYVAIHTTIFERLLAITRDRGNIGYLMYLADAFGYLGYVAVMVARNVVSRDVGFLVFFDQLVLTVIGIATLSILVSWAYFLQKLPGEAESTEYNTTPK